MKSVIMDLVRLSPVVVFDHGDGTGKSMHGIERCPCSSATTPPEVNASEAWSLACRVSSWAFLACVFASPLSIQATPEAAGETTKAPTSP